MSASYLRNFPWFLQVAESVKYVYLFSSGYQSKLIFFYIGPTHDDITYDSIAEAFNVPLIEHDPTVKNMLRHYKTDSLDASKMRMATVPQAKTVFETPGLWVPLVQVNNVLILPGVPLLFKRMIDNWFEKELNKFVQRGDLSVTPKMRISIKTNWKESDIAEKLSLLQKSVKEFEIALGSYPKLFEDQSTFVIISISGSFEFREEIEKVSKEISKCFDGVEV